MGSYTQTIVSKLIIWLSIFSLIMPARTARAQTPPSSAQPAPPAGQGLGQGSTAGAAMIPEWFKSQEKIPNEVKDKEKERPATSCTAHPELVIDSVSISVISDVSSAMYFDHTTGIRITITKTNTVTQRQGEPSHIRTIWKIETSKWELDERHRENIKHIKTIIYELGGRTSETRTERVGADPPTTRPARESDLFDPSLEQPKRGSFLWPSHSHWLTNVAYRAFPPRSMVIGENFSSHSPALLLAAATQERPSIPMQQTEERPQHNLKVVTIGGPLSDPVIVFFEPPPQTTPEEFVQNPPGSTWDPSTDPAGPTTAIPGPDGVPLTGIPVGYVNIGSGWASERVHSSGLTFCSDGPPSGITTESRQNRAQANLPNGGEVVVAPDYGWINLPNGTRVNRWKNGDRTISRRNGFGMTYFPESGWHFTLPDRTEVTINDRATTVRLPDGKTITRRRDGKVVEERPDGTETPFTGRTGDIKLPGGGELDMSSGYTAIIKTPDGTEIRTLHGEGGSTTQVTSQDGSQITASDDSQIILTRPGHPGIKMEKDGETVVNPLGPGEPIVRLKTNGMVDVVPFGGRIY